MVTTRTSAEARKYAAGCGNDPGDLYEPARPLVSVLFQRTITALSLGKPWNR